MPKKSQGAAPKKLVYFFLPVTILERVEEERILEERSTSLFLKRVLLTGLERAEKGERPPLPGFTDVAEGRVFTRLSVDEKERLQKIADADERQLGWTLRQLVIWELQGRLHPLMEVDEEPECVPIHRPKARTKGRKKKAA